MGCYISCVNWYNSPFAALGTGSEGYLRGFFYISLCPASSPAISRASFAETFSWTMALRPLITAAGCGCCQILRPYVMPAAPATIPCCVISKHSRRVSHFGPPEITTLAGEPISTILAKLSGSPVQKLLMISTPSSRETLTAYPTFFMPYRSLSSSKQPLG